MCHPQEWLPGLLQPVTAALAAFSRSIHPIRLLLCSPGSRGPVWPCVPAGRLDIGEGSSIEAAGCGGERSLGWGERQPCPIAAPGTFRGVASSGAGSSGCGGSCRRLLSGFLLPACGGDAGWTGGRTGPRSAEPGPCHGASGRAGPCPDRPLLSSRWALPQARYLQGQCPHQCGPTGAGAQRVSSWGSVRLQSPLAPGCLGWQSRAAPHTWVSLALGTRWHRRGLQVMRVPRPQVQCIATLQVGSIQAGNVSECGQCFSLSWMPSKPHHHLAAGFYDGESCVRGTVSHGRAAGD